jgi:hypothetical protein
MKQVLRKTLVAAAVTLPLLYAGASMAAPNSGQNGTTLAASKTLEICSLPDGLWRYSGEVSIWNEGALDTVGLIITDTIQNKVSGNTWITYFKPLDTVTGVIPAGTTLATATVFPYSVDGQALSGDIRNVASITITNHSGSLGTPKGPEPKFTFSGTVQPCPTEGGCTYTQGYWGNKPNVTWPTGYNRTDPFFNSGMTWQGMLDSSTGGNGYIILAQQYIAAVLNKANGAYVPSGLQTVLNDSAAFFTSKTTPEAACPLSKDCGPQKTWAGFLDSYNNGNYPDGPSHCE